jgi:hypothetical protein
MSPVNGGPMADPFGLDNVALRDGRQSAAAMQIARGVGRLLASLGHASVSELCLPNGRRADVVALSAKGDFWIVEIKSSVEDFRADQKWPEYWEFCDQLYFAVAPTFPQELLPQEAGLIVADRYGGEIVRPVPEVRLPAHRRRAMALRFGRVAAARLQSIADPGLALDALMRGD